MATGTGRPRGPAAVGLLQHHMSEVSASALKILLEPQPMNLQRWLYRHDRQRQSVQESMHSVISLRSKLMMVPANVTSPEVSDL